MESNIQCRLFISIGSYTNYRIKLIGNIGGLGGLCTVSMYNYPK